MDRQEYDKLELIPSVNDQAVLKASSWLLEQRENNAAYQVESRLKTMRPIGQAAVDAVCDLDDYIAGRAADRHPAVIAGLRELQDTTARCANLLILHYMARPL